MKTTNKLIPGDLIMCDTHWFLCLGTCDVGINKHSEGYRLLDKRYGEMMISKDEFAWQMRFHGENIVRNGERLSFV